MYLAGTLKHPDAAVLVRSDVHSSARSRRVQYKECSSVAILQRLQRASDSQLHLGSHSLVVQSPLAMQNLRRRTFKTAGDKTKGSALQWLQQRPHVCTLSTCTYSSRSRVDSAPCG